jgi:HEAT repeat protein
MMKHQPRNFEFTKMNLIHAHERTLSFSGIVFVLVVFVVFLPLEAVSDEPPKQKPSKSYENAVSDLNKAGYKVVREDLERLLLSVVPNSETVAVCQQLFAELVDPEFAVREKATSRLITLANIDTNQLETALKSEDPEARFRAEQIVQGRAERRFELMLIATARVAEQHPEFDLVDEFVRSVEFVTSPLVVSEFQRSTRVLATARNEPLLRDCMKSPSQQVVLLALHGLNAIDTGTASQIVVEALKHSDEKIRLATAIMLAQKRSTAGLPEMANLLQSSQPEIRRDAIRWLRTTTRQKLPFDYRASPESQVAQRDAWQQWLKMHLADLVIETNKGGPPKLERLLVCEYSTGKITEIDLEGKVYWESQAANAFACKGLPNGHRLIGQYSTNRIAEYDEEGKEVWHADGVSGSISGVDRSDSGRTLIACGQDGNRLVEIDENGEKILDIQIPGTPVGATYIGDDLFLVALFTKKSIAEVDREGNILKEIAVESGPYQVTLLDNSNYLVRYSDGGAAEYTADGTIVWKGNATAGYSVQRLDDGSTLIADQQGIRRIAEDQTETQIGSFKGYIYFHYY